mgnify:CR=1 FL=1
MKVTEKQVSIYTIELTKEEADELVITIGKLDQCYPILETLFDQLRIVAKTLRPKE